MQTTIALAALAAVAYAAPQGVTEDIAPKAPAPPGCSENYNGEFQIAAVKVAPSKRDLEKRQSTCGSEGSLTLTLKDGVLLDGQKRTGYIADNYQFQFDGPAQTGAIYTDGFSACPNTSLALGGSTVFYQCLSGSFYNLYDRSWAPQCEPVALQILGCSGSSPSNGVGQIGDGQVTGTAVGSPVTQIGDGQIQGPTNVPVITELPDGQPQAPTIMPAPITQIGDGQIQAPSGTPVTQIGDGQIQAPTGAPVVSQISDGQVQAPTGVVSQISDGQVQAPTGTVAPITQIGDGQIQAPTGSVAPITQIGDGQIQAPTGTPNATSAVEFTGAGNSLVAASGLAGLMALVALLL